MTRINTNVSSLNAQKSLARSNEQLQQALTRLSTGLRINTGKDDPAGLIASEILRSDIVSTNKAVSNSELANQMIATADSALGQVSSLLNDIRGLVVEAANKGALSADQIQANQLQIDSSLDAIDRIAQTTQFQGSRLLDGSLDFVTQNVDATKMTNLQVDQANFGTLSQIDVNVEVVSQAIQAVLTHTGSQLSGAATVEIGGISGFQTFSFGAGTTIQQIATAINLVSDATGVEASLNNRVATAASSGQAKLMNIDGTKGILVVADTEGKTPGDFTIRYAKGAATGVNWTASSPNVIDVTLETSQWATAGAAAVAVSVGEGSNTMTLAAKIAGSQFDGVDLLLVDGVGDTATYDYANNLVTVTTDLGAKATGAAPVAIGNANTLSVAAKITGSQFNAVHVEITNDGGDTATYDYTTNTITVDTTIVGSTGTSIANIINTSAETQDLFTATGVDGAGDTVAATYDNLSSNDGADGAKASDIATLINAQLGNLFTAAYVDDTTDANAFFATAGTKNNLSDNAGADGGTVLATMEDVRAIIDTLGNITATAIGAGLDGVTADVINYSGAIGDLNNASGTDQPNNRIQLTGTDPAAHKDVIFRANGLSQSLSISFLNNTRTNGRSTAYLQGATSVLKVEAVAQGSDNDGWTFNIVNSGTEESIVYDKETKTVTYTNALAGKTATEIADELTAVVGTQFQVTAVSGGGTNFANAASGVTADGSIYDGVYVNLATDANGVVTSTAAEVVAAINANPAMQSLGIAAANVTYSNGAGVAATGTVTLMEMGKTASNAAATGTTFAANGSTARVTVTAKTAGAAYSGVKVMFANDGVDGSEYATYDATNKILTFHVVSGTTTSDNLASRFLTGSGTAQSVKDLFTVTGSGAGAVTSTDIGWLTGGVTYSGTSLGGVDSEGNYDANQVIGTAGLSIKSSEYGSKQFVSVKALSGTFTTYNSSSTAAERTIGTDANVRINGSTAVTDGLAASLNTATLTLNFRLVSTLVAGTSFDFQITSGGAQFQLGPQVVSNQQTRLGLGSVNVSKLGGVNGTLYELRSGNAKSLASDTTGGAKVVEEAITYVSTLRGRLGAFQKTTLDTNINSLNDTLENLTAAESTIRDADFAAESANLTRAQILAQSGLSVLAIANSRPQQVLSLLRQ